MSTHQQKERAALPPLPKGRGIRAARLMTKKFHFWMDARRFSSDQERLTGAEIKAIAGTNRLYPVYRDTGPHFSDHEPVWDGVLVDIDGEHFYALIPATYGTQLRGE